MQPITRLYSMLIFGFYIRTCVLSMAMETASCIFAIKGYLRFRIICALVPERGDKYNKNEVSFIFHCRIVPARSISLHFNIKGHKSRRSQGGIGMTFFIYFEWKNKIVFLRVTYFA